MPKVYGTGVYDFRRHRVAEYPIDTPAPPPPVQSSEPPAPLAVEKPPPIGSLAQPITLSEIQRDLLTRVAAANWGPSVTDTEFKPEVVKEIYETEPMVTDRGRKTVPLHRVMILEVSQYLENYLWPNFDSDLASFEHVMSMILMVNEKFRENVAAWVCFHDKKEAFKGFLWRVLRLKEEQRAFSMAEKTNYLLFMINAFQSLEDEIVSEIVLQLVSLRLWHSLSFGRFQMELSQNPHLIKKWKKMTKREAKDAKKGGEGYDPTNVLEVRFLRNLIEEFLEILDSKVMLSEEDSMEEQVDESCVLYCERFMEFLIDLLSQLPTRR